MLFEISCFYFRQTFSYVKLDSKKLYFLAKYYLRSSTLPNWHLKFLLCNVKQKNQSCQNMDMCLFHTYFPNDQISEVFGLFLEIGASNQSSDCIVPTYQPKTSGYPHHIPMFRQIWFFCFTLHNKKLRCQLGKVDDLE